MTESPFPSIPFAKEIFVGLPALYFVALIFYRFYLHPLSKYPGPKVAAVSCPVVRITPNTLHFRNPQAFHDIFSPQNKTVKDQEFYHHLGLPDSSFRLEGEEHAARLKLMSPLLGRNHMDDIQTIVRRNVQRFCDLLQCSMGNEKPIELALGYRGLALDIINEFIFAVIPDNLRGLENEKFRNPLSMSTYYSFDWTMWLMRNFPLTCHFHDFASYLPLQSQIQLRPTERDDRALLDEAIGVMHGGVLDISNVLPYGTFHLAQDPKAQQKLYEELKGVWKNPADPIPDHEILRNLPYLKGLVKETLRFTHGVISGMPRIVTANGAQIDGYSIPPGTIVATTSVYVHMDPTVFSNPEQFSPERWANGDPQLERSLVPFSKGRRMCPAQNISYMEISAAFAAVFRRFEVSLYETT
ncbi:Cytochrome P450 E-class group I [Penicillium expansum]|nr:Cytochrome P450 E-class group I [Penicillium expansum]